MSTDDRTSFGECERGVPWPHMAHADGHESLRPADPPFGRTLADDMAAKKVRITRDGATDTPPVVEDWAVPSEALRRIVEAKSTLTPICICGHRHPKGPCGYPQPGGTCRCQG